MTVDPEYRKSSILFIDDEAQSQKYFSQIFGKIFHIHLASNGEEGLALFQQKKGEIGVVVSDQRMPGMGGSELLSEIARENPDVVNILSTAYSDLDAAIDAVNEGGIYRYVTKPWDLAEFEVTLRRAMDLYQLKEQHRLLARVKIAGLEQMFHQSRLLACLAIPALMTEVPSSIRAFRDLLRLSLDLNELEPYSQFASLRGLSQEGRLEMIASSKNALQPLIALIDAGREPSANQLEELEALLIEQVPGEQSVLVSSFFMLLQGVPEEEDLQSLALLISAYEAGYEISKKETGWKMSSTGSDPQSYNTFEELYSLFVDDPYLVGAILGNLK